MTSNNNRHLDPTLVRFMHQTMYLIRKVEEYYQEFEQDAPPETDYFALNYQRSRKAMLTVEVEAHKEAVDAFVIALESSAQTRSTCFTLANARSLQSVALNLPRIMKQGPDIDLIGMID